MAVPSTSAERFRLLFAILAWLVPRKVATIEEISERFSLDRDDVSKIIGLAACCGVPPYSPDALLDVYVDQDTVKANLGEAMGRPRRLSAPEGFILSASIRALLSISGTDQRGHLRTVLDKLESALGKLEHLEIEVGAPAHLDEVRNALESGKQLEIEYYSSSSDKTTSRRVEPFHLFSESGYWYLDAYCHLAEDVRHFRVDRIRSVRRLDQNVENQFQEREFFSEAERVVLMVPENQRELLDGVAHASISPGGDGMLRVELPVGGTAWLARLLLVLGPQARVISPAAMSGAGDDAARKILANYPGHRSDTKASR